MSTTTRPTYGNWIQQRSAGLGGAGLLGTACLMGGLVFALLGLMVGGVIPALVLLAIFGLAFTATGTPIGRRFARRVGFTRQRRAGEHQWRSGMFTRNKNASIRLPGMLGKTTLLERDDAFGNPFVVIKNPRKGGLYTIVARCVAEGPWMQDQDRINSWVAGFGGVLAATGQETALVCAKAITDTAPDPGGRLSAMVHSLRDTDAPSVATAVMDECLADYPSASSENITYLELTFRGRGLHRKGDETAMLSELARKVPGVLGQVHAAGGGSVDMVTKAELPRLVRAAYDPAAQKYLEQAELAGDGHHVEWHDAGPVACQESWDHLLHDSGQSITWEMFGAPRAAITELALSGLLMPHRDFTRKRVALIFRPHTPEESAKVSETDANTATFTAQQGKKRVSATGTLRMKATEQSRQEVASGAVLIRLSILITATVTDAEDLVQAAATVESRAGAVPIRVRRSYGSQAAAFAATLPVGFVPWEHTVVPDKVRELM